MEILGRLAGPVIHDLNNLLTVIQLNTSLLEEDLVDGEERRTMIQEVSKACQSASELTKTMLSITRKRKADKGPMEACRFVAGITGLLEALVSRKATLDVGLPEEEIWLDAEYSGLGQVLMNLVINAVDAAPGKKISLDLSKISQVPGKPPSQEFAIFTVRDSGSGIPSDVLPHIFDPFFTTKEAGKGTGLGLSIVHETVSRHGGWVEVDTRPGNGTTFRIFLPAVAKVSSRPSGEHPPQGKTSVPSGLSVLIVEDDPGIRAVAKAILERDGCRVFESADADEAMAVWTAKQNEISLLFADLVLPGARNGRDLARELLHERSNLRVLYTSGYDRPEGDNSSGIENFIAKPYAPTDLTNEVRRIMAGRAKSTS
jgi:two-component system, cell cycle sensor histidine kinase and response regulator CckA